jgi:hypothetical protein
LRALSEYLPRQALDHRQQLCHAVRRN